MKRISVPDTLKAFETMELYNPDKSWKPTEDSWPEDEEPSSEKAEEPATEQTPG